MAEVEALKLQQLEEARQQEEEQKKEELIQLRKELVTNPACLCCICVWPCPRKLWGGPQAYSKNWEREGEPVNQGWWLRLNKTELEVYARIVLNYEL